MSAEGNGRTWRKPWTLLRRTAPAAVSREPEAGSPAQPPLARKAERVDGAGNPPARAAKPRGERHAPAPPSITEIRPELERYQRLTGQPSVSYEHLIGLIGIPDTVDNRRLSHQLYRAIVEMSEIREAGVTGERWRVAWEAARGAAERLTAEKQANANARLRDGAGLPGSRRRRRLNWRILPEASGSGEGGFRGFYERHLAPSGRSWDEARERLQPVWALGPREWYEGEELGSREYFVAVFDRVAIAECPDYGNALYYYRCTDSSWQRVFCEEKQVARALGAERIIHTENWERNLRQVVGQKATKGGVRR